MRKPNPGLEGRLNPGFGFEKMPGYPGSVNPGLQTLMPCALFVLITKIKTKNEEL
jgi:hypothetical protein